MDPLDRLLDILGLKQPKKKAAEAKKTAPANGAAPKPPQSLNLEASDLLPITGDELRMSLQQLIRSGGWRFTARGTVPLGDERSRLINRALLTQGYLTPEQLDEVIGAALEHERLEQAMVLVEAKAERAGEAAVKADKEARAKLKEQKKKEAAEREEARRRAVEERRASDIIFLGTGVSARLNDRQSDTARLESLGLPALSTPKDLADALGLDVPRLRWLAFHTDVATRLHYVHFRVPKKSGGHRVLSAPHRTLAAAQQWVHREVLSKLPVEDCCHGFFKGRGIMTNAAPHVGKPVLLNMDLEDFFPSISWVRVRALFQRLGYSGAVATTLALLCTECPRESVEYAGQIYYVAAGQRGLPQGACTSPALSNAIARRLDRRLAGLAAKLGLAYTRYADDLTFSGDGEFNAKVGYVMARVRHVAEDEGFRVNVKKTRVLRRNSRQEVTGIVVNEKPNLPRAERRRLRAILHNAQKQGIDAQNRDGRPNYPEWLLGKITFAMMVRPDLGAGYLEQFKQAVLAGEPAEPPAEPEPEAAAVEEAVAEPEPPAAAPSEPAPEPVSRPAEDEDQGGFGAGLFDE